MSMTHRKAVWVMVTAALLWSIAGVVSRHLEAARGFEVTFWRSGFNALALVVLLSWLKGPGPLWATLRGGGRALWLSGACWAVMYTAFMMALTLTSVANVLVTMSIGPLLTALLARAALGHRLAPRTWGAIAMAGVGIAWMYGHEVVGNDPKALLGTLVALAVPLAAAVNWTLLQHLKNHDTRPDMLAAVLLGALLSAAATLPLAWPLAASPHDLSLLALLGVVQLAIPCLLAVAAARVLSAPEVALLGLLETVFGVLWAWLGAGEAPQAAVLGGGALVLLALGANAWLGLRDGPSLRHPLG
ncbi:MAG: permease [Leptothrix sp. (in: Bacteria)]|nr:permease [Leptothrix sp. (in: b-proteobacteria)]